MYDILSQSRLLTGDRLEFSDDAILAAARQMIVTISVLLLVAWYALGATDLGLISLEFLGLGAGLVVVAGISFWLVGRNLAAGSALWLAGFAGMCLFAQIQFPAVPLRLLWMILPFMVVILFKPWAGILTGLAVASVLAGTNLHKGMGIFSDMITQITLLGAGILGLVGWAAVGPFNRITFWAVYYSNRTQLTLAESSERQEVLFQTQADLVQANEEMARLNQRLKELQHATEEARQAKTEFVANVSHEFRAPLNMIIGFSEIIARSPRAYGSKIPSPLLADIATIQRNATHLARLVDDVLDLSQIETGRMAISREVSQIPPIVEGAVAVVRSLFESKGLYLEVSLAPDMPSVYCDPIRIRQILVNLLSNAGRFTQTGGVRLIGEVVTNEIILRVTDTGEGIAKEDQQRLFQPFQQAKSSIRRELSGSGLGLNISKHFVELHGGRIWLESELGLGTTINFTLPLDPPKPYQPSSPTRRWVNEYASRERRSRPSFAPLPDLSPHLMVLESGSTLSRLFARYAGEFTCLPVTAWERVFSEISHSPVQALLVNTPALLTPDNLAGITHQASQIQDGTPVLSCWLPGREEIATELGAIDYLIKPVAPHILLEHVQALTAPVRRILIVEDDPDLLQLYLRTLAASPAGYKVMRAENGQEALEMTRNNRPDLVILDLILPEMNGYEFLREKRTEIEIRDIPVMIVSSTDPVSEARTAETLLLHRRGGLGVQELTELSRALSLILSPAGPLAGPAQPEAAPG